MVWQSARLDEARGTAALAPASPLDARAWSLDYLHPLADGWWRAGLEAPMRVESGTLALRLAAPFEDWNAPMRRTERLISAVPSGREWRARFGRDWAFGEDGLDAIGVRVSIAHEPGHVAGADAEADVGVSARLRF